MIAAFGWRGDAWSIYFYIQGAFYTKYELKPDFKRRLHRSRNSHLLLEENSLTIPIVPIHRVILQTQTHVNNNLNQLSYKFYNSSKEIVDISIKF